MEAPPARDDPRQGQQRSMSTGSAVTDVGRTPSTPSSPHMRLDPRSSTSPTVTAATTVSAVATSAEAGGDPSPYNAGDEHSPTFPTQAIFSAKDGSDPNAIRRPSRRRTGPLSASQREKAALIRKLGACNDCRRRRVAVSEFLRGDSCCFPALSPEQRRTREHPKVQLLMRCSNLLHTVPPQPPQYDLGRCSTKVQVA